jgi:hypothetical protein
MKSLEMSERWMYKGGRPNQLAAVLNRGWVIVHAAGLWPNRLATLEVRGRRTGRLVSFPVVVATYEGGRYLVAMLGERTNWVSNVRAAGGQAVLRHGYRETVRLDEVDAGLRAPVLRRYLEVAPGARAHIPVDRRAPLTAFERISGEYPVFRICGRPPQPVRDHPSQSIGEL